MNTYMERVFELVIVFSLGLMIGSVNTSMVEIGRSVFWVSIILYILCVILEELKK